MSGLSLTSPRRGRAARPGTKPPPPPPPQPRPPSSSHGRRQTFAGDKKTLPVPEPAGGHGLGTGTDSGGKRSQAGRGGSLRRYVGDRLLEMSIGASLIFLFFIFY